MRSLLLGVLSILAWSHLHGISGLSANESSPLVAPEIRRAVDAGVARVLVEVRVPRATVPEGGAPEAGDLASRGGAIAAAQGAVLSRLPSSHFSVVRQFETVPFLALEIDADALTALERLGTLVERIVPDRTMAPGRQP